jgi:ribosomal protein S18 acetylase RimI-like enzyme
MTAWQIREASAEDVAAIIALFAIADDAAAAGAPHQFRGAWAAPRSEREVLGLLEHPDVALFVAELEGRVVGQVVARKQILDVQPTELHQRVPLYIGSKLDVANAVRMINA